MKRGPSGVIGTNKPDSLETVTAMLEDAAAGRTLGPLAPSTEAVTALLCERHVRWFSFAEWQRLEAMECAAGEARGCPRVKFTSPTAMRAALESAAHS